MGKPIIDILLPVFNGAPTIQESIESLLYQSISDIRVIVIDDGSTDYSPSIVAHLATRDPRIIVLTQSNRGIVDALNFGLERTSAEFVARQDADDISLSNRLELELDYLKKHDECLAVSGGVEHIDEHGRLVGHVERFGPPELCDPFWAPAREPYLIHPFLMIRRDTLISVGGYRYAFHAEDTDLYWRVLERGKMHNMPAILGYYRTHAKSISGGSILNGRIMALNSQLAALSARRRRERRPDIAFSKEAIGDYRGARTLSKLHEIAVRQLNEEESRYLRIAMAGKMLELSAYRPYELEAEDCRFIRSARQELKLLSSRNRRQLDRLLAAAAARLLRKRMLFEAAQLLPPAMYGSVVARLIATGLLPQAALTYIGRMRTLK